MEEFERQLGEAKSKDEDEEEAEETAATAFNDIDETEHGENPFARPDDAPQEGGDSQPWLGSDRDYTYAEVSMPSHLLYLIR